MLYSHGFLFCHHTVKVICAVTRFVSDGVAGADGCHSGQCSTPGLIHWGGLHCVPESTLCSAFERRSIWFTSEQSQTHQSGTAFIILHHSVDFKVGEMLVFLIFYCALFCEI